MIAQFFSVAFIALFGAMLPGPDFAIVVKNSMLHSRQSGYFTSLGIGVAILVHMTYCIFGLALVIAGSPFLFNFIKYIGACYLIYLGIQSIKAKQSKNIFQTKENNPYINDLSSFTSFKQGFLCNLLNPKATMFFLSLFTVLIKADTPLHWSIIYGLEIAIIGILWFCSLTIILSHPKVKKCLQNAEQYIAKLLGIFLIGFGLALAFFSH